MRVPFASSFVLVLEKTEIEDEDETVAAGGKRKSAHLPGPERALVRVFALFNIARMRASSTFPFRRY
jgi:hypothetical protein